MSNELKGDGLAKGSPDNHLGGVKTVLNPAAASSNISGSSHSVWNLCPLPLPSDAQAVDLRDITPSLSPVFTEDQVRELSQHAGDLDELLPPDAFKRITEVLTPEQTNLLINTCTSHYSDHDVSMSYADSLLGSLGQFTGPSLKHSSDPVRHESLSKVEPRYDLFPVLDSVGDKAIQEAVTTVVSSTTVCSTAAGEVIRSSASTEVIKTGTIIKTGASGHMPPVEVYSSNVSAAVLKAKSTQYALPVEGVGSNSSTTVSKTDAIKHTPSAEKISSVVNERDAVKHIQPVEGISSVVNNKDAMKHMPPAEGISSVVNETDAIKHTPAAEGIISVTNKTDAIKHTPPAQGISSVINETDGIKHAPPAEGIISNVSMMVSKMDTSVNTPPSEAITISEREDDEIKNENQNRSHTVKDGAKPVQSSPPKASYSLRSSPRKVPHADNTDNQSPSRNTRHKTQKAPVVKETRRSPRGVHKEPDVAETMTCPVRGKGGKRKEETKSPGEDLTEEYKRSLRRSTRVQHEPDASPQMAEAESPRRGRGRKKVTPKKQTKTSNEDNNKAKTDNNEGKTAKPGDSEAMIAKLGDSEAEIAKPGDSEAEIAKPGDSKAMIAKPGDSEAEIAKPGDSEAEIAKPSDSEARIAKPGESEAEITKPGDSETKKAKLGDSEDMTTKSGDGEAMTAQPGDSEAMTTKPGDSEANTDSKVMAAKPDDHEVMTTKPGDSEAMTTKPDDHEAMTTKPGNSETRTGKGYFQEFLFNKGDVQEGKTEQGDIQEDTVDSSVTLPSDVEEIKNKPDRREFESKHDSHELTQNISAAMVEMKALEADPSGAEDNGPENRNTEKQKQHKKKTERKKDSKEEMQPSRRSNRISESIRKREIEEAVRIAQEEMRREREEEERKIREEEEKIKREKEMEEESVRREKAMEEERVRREKGMEEESVRREKGMEEERVRREKGMEKKNEQTEKGEEEQSQKSQDMVKFVEGEKQYQDKKPKKALFASPKASKSMPEKDVAPTTPTKKHASKGKEPEHIKHRKMSKEGISKQQEKMVKETKEMGKKQKPKVLTDKEKMEVIKREKLRKVEEILSQTSSSDLFEFHQVKQGCGETPEKQTDDKEEEIESEEDDEAPVDEDSDYDPENDPQRLWCICRKPHGNKFMICCDTCEEWFHGDCVGITMAIGKQMEKTGIEYTCPKCLKAKRLNKDSTLPQEADSPVKVNKDGSPIARPRRHTRLKIPKEHMEKKESIVGGKRKHKDDSASERHRRRSSDSGYKIPKKVRTTPTPASFSSSSNNKCVNPHCNNFTKANSRYCSDTCIARYAEDSLNILAEERTKRLGSGSQHSTSATSPTSSLRSPMPWDKPSHTTTSSPRVSERVAVIEKGTGRVVAGVAAPTEGQLFYWLQKHPTFEVLRPSKPVTKEEKRRENKKEDEKSVRENVKRHLKEILTSRLKEIKDLHLSTDDISKFSVDIEADLFKLFSDAGHRYKNKYRSLAFNLKDRRNKVLFYHVLSGEVSTERLVNMTPEQLASQELARWRERETKHTLEMITQNLEDINPTKGHIKKTHKGEVELDEDEDMSNLEVHALETAAADSNTSPGPLLLDTTDQHRIHLFDLNCRICTGKMAPPGELPRPEEPTPIIVSTTSPILALAESSVPSPPPLDMTSVSSTDSLAPVSPTPHNPSKREQAVWKGFVMMQNVSKFGTNAYKVSGPCDDLLHLLPDTLHLQGRIGFEQVSDYIYQLRSSTSRVVSVIRYEASAEEEKTSYVSLYSYFYSRKRCGVVSNCYTGVKDMYLMPLASHAAVPKELLPFDGPGLEEPRPHMMLGIIVRTKPSFKRPRAVSHHKSTSPKRKRPHHSSSKPRSVSQDAPHLRDSPPAEIDDIVFQFHSAQTKKNAEPGAKPSPSQSTGGSSGAESPAISHTASNTESPLAALLAEKQQLLMLQQKAITHAALQTSTQESSDEKPIPDDTPYDPEEEFDLDLELEKPVNLLMESKKSSESTASTLSVQLSASDEPHNTQSSLTIGNTDSSEPPTNYQPSLLSSTDSSQSMPACQPPTSKSDSNKSVLASDIVTTRPARPPLLPPSLVFPLDLSSSPAAELIKRLSKPGGIQPPVTTPSSSSPAASQVTPLTGSPSGKSITIPADSLASTNVKGAQQSGSFPTPSNTVSESPVTDEQAGSMLQSLKPLMTDDTAHMARDICNEAIDETGRKGPMNISHRQISDPGPPPGSISRPLRDAEPHRRSSSGDRLETEVPLRSRDPPYVRRPTEQQERDHIDRERLEWRERHSRDHRAECGTDRWTEPNDPSLSRRPQDNRRPRDPQGTFPQRPRDDRDQRDTQGLFPRRPPIDGDRDPNRPLSRTPQDDRDQRDPQEPFPRRPQDNRDQRDPHGPFSRRSQDDRDQRDTQGPFPRRPQDDRDQKDPQGPFPQRTHDSRGQRDPQRPFPPRPQDDRDQRDPQGPFPRRPPDERDPHGPLSRRPPDDRDLHGPLLRRPPDERDPHGPLSRRHPDDRDPHGPLSRRPPDVRDARNPREPFPRRPSDERYRDAYSNHSRGTRGRDEPDRYDGRRTDQRRYEADRWRDGWRR